MGRQAPNPQYQIIKCDAQAASGSYSGYTPGILPQLNYSFQTLFPIGSSGSGNAVNTGTIKVGSGVGSYTPYFNGCLVGVNDENRAIVDSTQATYSDSDDDLRYEPWFNYRFYTTYLSGATPSSGLFALKITGASIQKQQSLTGWTDGNGNFKQIFDYTDLDSTYSLITTYVNDRTTVSGGTVSLEIIQHTTTGVIQVTGLIITDTRNAGSAITNITFPSITKDLSYTGTTQRFLVGYQANSGLTSGQLCAVLVEISGTTMTAGTPVVIRSVVSSGCVGQFISTTYHSGVNSNCFVITTAVSPATAGTGFSASGQIIGAKPLSGLVLAGSFGTAVTNILTTTATGVFQPICTALNTFTGSDSYGIIVGVTGNASPASLSSGAAQMYTVSGAVIPVITTGVYSDFLSSVNSSGLSGLLPLQAYARISSGNFNPPRLIEISSKVTTSGLISYTSYSNIRTIIESGTAAINYIHVPYSLASTGKTQYISVTGAVTVATANRIPSNQFFNLPTNPYNGVHGSFIFLNSNTYLGGTGPVGSGIGLGTLATTTGYFPNGIATTASSYFGGSFFQGILRTDNESNTVFYSLPASMRFRSFYAITSGTSNSVPVFDASGINYQFATGTLTPVRFKGTYPNYTGMVALHYNNMYDISFSSTTGQQQYNLLTDVFKTPIPKADSINSRVTYIDRKPESVGIVVNPSGLITSGTGIINSGSLFSGTVLVKKALTEEAKKILLRDCVKSYIIVENHNVFE